MKSLIVLFSVLFSLSVFANADLLVGTYKGTDAVAVITKVQVAPATLFDAAKFQYVLNLESDKHQFGVKSVMTLSADKRALSVYTDSECDDPGCTYFEEISVGVTKTTAKPTMEVYFQAYKYDEDGRAGRSFEKSFKLVKIK